MSDFQHRTCLIFGVDGFLGSHLARALAGEGARVVGTALNRKGESSLAALCVSSKLWRLEYGDVVDPYFVSRVINAYEVDYVFYLAAVSAVRIARAYPYRAFQTNTLGALNVLEASRCSRRPVAACVLASSDKAYGATPPPYFEELRLEPRGTYEASKAAMEMIARGYRFEHRLPIGITRCANLYGPGDLAWSRIVPGSTRRALAGDPPVVYQESATSTREFLYVEDACRAYMALALHLSNDKDAELEYNVGGAPASVWEVAAHISRLAGGPVPLILPREGEYVEIAAQEINWPRMAALGWAPQVTLVEGLERTVEWYRAYLAGCVRVNPLVSALVN